jgi:hypothetical protein
MSGFQPGSLVETWNRLYTRRQFNLYRSEDEFRLNYQINDQASFMATFFERDTCPHLDPATVFKNCSLQNFLAGADIRSIDDSNYNPSWPEIGVLLDERLDTTGDGLSTRLWDSEGDGVPGSKRRFGYSNRPPPGHKIISEEVSIGKFVSILRESVSSIPMNN